MNENMIEVNDLNKSFKDLKVLEDVCFNVKQGEIFALLGSNGAGKTTIIKILSTLLNADKGDMKVCGYDVYSQALNVRKSISLTGQFSAVDEVLTGRENLVLIAKLRHQSQPYEIANQLLEKFRLSDAGYRHVSTYSGGMKRRLDIAMSLIGSPRIIFLDEPTTGLDPKSRIEVWKQIQELSQGGTTIFLTTQYLDEAEQLADRIAILHSGKIIACGSFDELKRQFPPTHVEYIEKQPTLEEIFLAIINKKEID